MRLLHKVREGYTLRSWVRNILKHSNRNPERVLRILSQDLGMRVADVKAWIDGTHARRLRVAFTADSADAVEALHKTTERDERIARVMRRIEEVGVHEYAQTLWEENKSAYASLKREELSQKHGKQ